MEITKKCKKFHPEGTLFKNLNTKEKTIAKIINEKIKPIFLSIFSEGPFLLKTILKLCEINL